MNDDIFLNVRKINKLVDDNFLNLIENIKSFILNSILFEQL